jgi:predicted nucleic acid-binding protein
MITAVDTNILIDVLEPDPVHGPASLERLRTCLQEGAVVACEVVWAEVSTAYAEVSTAYAHALAQVAGALHRIGIGYTPMIQEDALAAAQHWYVYRQQGGTRERIVADFLIGGHAITQCDRLLRRDRGFYRSYFTSLTLIAP